MLGHRFGNRAADHGGDLWVGLCACGGRDRRHQPRLDGGGNRIGINTGVFARGAQPTLLRSLAHQAAEFVRGLL